jgi:type I restriction enzyme S subunit
MKTPLVRIGDLSEQVRGVSYGKQDASTEPLPGYLPVLRAGNITDDGLVFEDLVYVPAERISSKQKIRHHDVVIAASSGSLDVVGKAAPAPADFDGAFGAFCKVLRPKSNVHPVYFAHFFKTKHYRQRVSALAAGVNINNLRNEHLDDMKIPLPPLVEQQRIADILDRAEALRAKRRAALAQLDTLTQAIFLDLFGNPFSNSKNWPITRLMNVSLAINDCPHSTPFWTAHGAICLRTSNLNEGGWNWEDTRYVSEETFAQRSSRGFLETGDIILSREGTVGIAAIVPDGLRMCMGQRLVQVRAADDKLVPEFLLYYLLQILVQDRISQFMVGSTSQHLNVKELRNLPVPLPPLLLQREFARRIAAVEKLKAAHRASLVEMDALFASLQHRAFQGEL